MSDQAHNQPTCHKHPDRKAAGGYFGGREVNGAVVPCCSACIREARKLGIRCFEERNYRNRSSRRERRAERWRRHIEARKAGRDPRFKVVMAEPAGRRLSPAEEEWLRLSDPLAWYDHDPDDGDYSALEDDVDDFEEAVANCHMGPDGSCGAAGSEWCDWQCPFSDEEPDDGA